MPPALLPAEFSWHDYAIFLLSMAAEIEHSLMVQYLYAAYSLGGPQVPEQHRGNVLEWQQVILGIAKEEMATSLQYKTSSRYWADRFISIVKTILG